MQVNDKSGFWEGFWWCEMNFLIIDLDTWKGKVMVKGVSIFKSKL